MADELNVNCRKRFPSGFELRADLRIPLDASPVTVLFGSSGSGKTTLLRLIAGLETPDSGEILFRGSRWFDSSAGICLPPQQRRAGFLFQDYALFPHLTVAQNVSYAARDAHAGEMLKTFGLVELAGRLPRAISGGQQQRVALARALAARPALLLLDEPLSALDHATRARMRHELRRALTASGVSALVVTHDRTEAVALGDWMAVMVEGGIRQFAPAHEVFRHPADARVAESVGVENVLPAVIVERGQGLIDLRIGQATVQCVDEGAQAFGAGPYWASIRAEDVTISREPIQPSSARNRMAGTVVSVAVGGPLARVEIDCGFPLVAAITAQSAADLALKTGDCVHASVKAMAVHLVSA